MRQELEEKKREYERLTQEHKCVVCGDALENHCKPVETLTGWKMCGDCWPYADDDHYWALRTRLEAKAEALGMSVDALPDTVKAEVIWEVEI